MDLIHGLLPFNVELIDDEQYKAPPGAYATAVRSWRLGAASDATHVLVIEDDTILCKDFCKVLVRAVETRPDHIIELFSAGGVFSPMFAEAQAKNLHWVDQNCHCCGPALLMPRAMVAEYLVWQAENISPHCQHIDDFFVRLFAIATGRLISNCVPSLVQHDPSMLSIVGNQPNSEAQAWCFAADDAPAIQWSSEGLAFRLDDIRSHLYQFIPFFAPGAKVLRDNGID